MPAMPISIITATFGMCRIKPGHVLNVAAVQFVLHHAHAQEQQALGHGVENNQQHPAQTAS